MVREHLLQFRIVSVIQETPLAKSYILERADGKELQFRAGQFLTFIFKTHKQELRRSYSIVSLPGEPIKITVKKVENGEISRYILLNWKTGYTVTSLAPAGRFTVEPQKLLKRDIFCFAAGSGIVPILPQVKVLLTEEPQSIIHLIYSNHNEEDSLFLQEIESLAGQFSSLHLITLFSDPLFRLNERGRLSNLTTETLVNKILRFKKEDALFLICGPFSYMRMLVFTLGLMGFDRNNIRKENYLPEIMRSAKLIPKGLPNAKVFIKYHNKNWQVEVKSGQSILDAGLGAGIDLPYSCKGGICGNCAAKCRDGKVHMSINEVLTDGDIQNNWILTCTAYPESSDVSIDFDLQ